MESQNFKKHSQYVPGFHFVTLGIIIAAIFIAIILMIHNGFSHSTSFGLLVALSLGGLFFYTRQFATRNQDRIIRAEENFRSYRLTGKELDPRLTRSQIVALRFANDEEYTGLAQKATKENLSPGDIKGAIQQWRSDHHRV